MLTVFIDNGVTGSIGVYGNDGPIGFYETPSIRQQDYTKAKQQVSRLDVSEFIRLMMSITGGNSTDIILERPMINPQRFKASLVAIRCYEATISALEAMGLGYRIVDSKEWQRRLLPSSGKKGVDSKTLKQESFDIGIRMFPQFAETIRKHKDADGILGAYVFHKEGK